MRSTLGASVKPYSERSLELVARTGLYTAVFAMHVSV